MSLHELKHPFKPMRLNEKVWVKHFDLRCLFQEKEKKKELAKNLERDERKKVTNVNGTKCNLLVILRKKNTAIILNFAIFYTLSLSV